VQHPMRWVKSEPEIFGFGSRIRTPPGNGVFCRFSRGRLIRSSSKIAAPGGGQPPSSSLERAARAERIHESTPIARHRGTTVRSPSHVGCTAVDRCAVD
jgi:hypothetical protein